MELLGAGARVLQVLEREVLRIDVPLRYQIPAQRVPEAADGERTAAAWRARTVAGYVVLAGRVEQVGVARAFARKLLGGDPLLDTALLVVSEMVSNSVQHSRSSLPGGTVTLYILHVDARVRIEVQDDGSDGIPCMRPAGSEAFPEWSGDLDEVDLRGRGLRLVDEVATCWGFAIGHRKTTTWAELSSSTDSQSPT
ncbi:ATP-binding protein [Sphaerisporangium sp. NPDC004334]